MVSAEIELRSLCYDPDPRTRADAVRRLEQMCAGERAVLSMDSYSAIRDLCKNSAVNVRASALRLLVKFAHYYAEYRTTTERGFELRLHDDVFIVVCNALNDAEVSIRAEATAMLAHFRAVSANFLQQTLDKKIMRQMKVRSLIFVICNMHTTLTDV